MKILSSSRAIGQLLRLNKQFTKCYSKFYSSLEVPEVLSNLEKKFEEAKIPEAKSSARHLVASIFNETNIDKFLSTSNQLKINEDQLSLLETYSECRLARMPVQYIIGNWDFLDLTLKLRPPVFIPRPETEELVNLVINHLKSKTPHDELNVVEVGCGSGAISLSLAHYFPGLQVTSVDQSKMACDLTMENARALKLDKRLNILQAKVSEASVENGTFLPEILDNSVDLIVSNPPYILRKDLRTIAPEIAMYEDLRALDGGKDGLSVITPILLWGSKVLKPGGRIFLETDPCHPYIIPEHLGRLKSDANNFDIVLLEVCKDFAEKDRFVIFEKQL